MAVGRGPHAVAILPENEWICPMVLSRLLPDWHSKLA